MGCGSSKGAGPEGDMPREGESKEAATGPTHPWSNLPPANNIRSPTARRPANHKTSFAQLVGERKSEISARPASKENDADETALIEELDLDFFDRECVILGRGSYTTASAIARMDSGSDLPFCVSMRWLKEHGRLSEMDTNFEHPRVKTLAGSELSIQGVVRDMQFRLKGSSKTFRRDFFVSDALDDWYDFVLGKDFMKKNFDMLFGPDGKVQKMIGGLFGTNRRTPAERAQEAALKAQQEADAKNREADRLARKAKEKRQAEETQRIEEANFQSHCARNTN